MKARTALLVLLMCFVCAFAGFNWRLLAMPVHVNFLISSAEVPFGILLALTCLLLCSVFGIYLAAWQLRVINDYRRQSQDLQAQRLLADDAESSRFNTLSALMKSEIVQLEQHLTLALDALRTEVRDSEGSLAAQVAEMDDRLRHINPSSNGSS